MTSSTNLTFTRSARIISLPTRSGITVGFFCLSDQLSRCMHSAFSIGLSLSRRQCTTLRIIEATKTKTEWCMLPPDERNGVSVYALSLYGKQSSSSSYGVLFQSVAVSTMWRQSARPEAFLHEEERPMFRGLRSASTKRNQV